MSITYQEAALALLAGERFVHQFSHRVDKVDVLLALAKVGLEKLVEDEPDWKKRQIPAMLEV